MDKPGHFGLSGNFWKILKIKEKDKLIKNTYNQINNSNSLINKVETMHLLIEFWLNNMIGVFG
jgi:hypothetical protein